MRIHPLTDGMSWEYWQISGPPCKGRILRLVYDRDGIQRFQSDGIPDVTLELL